MRRFSQLKTRDLMTANPVTLPWDASLKEAIDLMGTRGIRHVPVLDEKGRLVGLITQRDYLTVAISKFADVSQAEINEIYSSIRVRDVMGKKVMTVDQDVSISDAARTMFEEKYGCLPVMHQGKLVGILTEADFVRMTIEESARSPLRRALSGLERLGRMTRRPFH